MSRSLYFISIDNLNVDEMFMIWLASECIFDFDELHVDEVNITIICYVLMIIHDCAEIQLAYIHVNTYYSLTSYPNNSCYYVCLIKRA